MEVRERRLVVVMDLNNLGPECLSLKAVGQKVTREDLSRLDLPR